MSQDITTLGGSASPCCRLVRRQMSQVKTFSSWVTSVCLPGYLVTLGREDERLLVFACEGLRQVIRVLRDVMQALDHVLLTSLRQTEEQAHCRRPGCSKPPDLVEDIETSKASCTRIFPDVIPMPPAGVMHFLDGSERNNQSNKSSSENMNFDRRKFSNPKYRHHSSSIVRAVNTGQVNDDWINNNDSSNGDDTNANIRLSVVNDNSLLALPDTVQVDNVEQSRLLSCTTNSNITIIHNINNNRNNRNNNNSAISDKNVNAIDDVNNNSTNTHSNISKFELSQDLKLPPHNLANANEGHITMLRMLKLKAVARTCPREQAGRSLHPDSHQSYQGNHSHDHEHSSTGVNSYSMHGGEIVTHGGEVDHEMTKDIVLMLRNIGDNLDSKIRMNEGPSILSLFGTSKVKLSHVMLLLLPQRQKVGLTIGMTLQLLVTFQRL